MSPGGRRSVHARAALPSSAPARPDAELRVVGTEGQREVVVVDPAWDVDAIEKTCVIHGKRLCGILLTHSHKDHTNGVGELLARRDLPVYANRAEIEFSDDLRTFGDALRPLGPGAPVVPLGRDRAQVIHTRRATLRARSASAARMGCSRETRCSSTGCGRCDLRGGDPGQMYTTLHQTLRKLPGVTPSLPGPRLRRRPGFVPRPRVHPESLLPAQGCGVVRGIPDAAAD